MGYFKEKDIEQKELLEKAMNVIAEIDDLLWMPKIILDRFESRDGKSRDAALVTLGRLCERMKVLIDDVPDILSDYHKFNESMRTDNEINVERTYDFVKAPHGFGKYTTMHERIHTPCYCDKLPKEWDEYLNKIMIKGGSYKPEDLYIKQNEPTGVKPKVKRGRPAKKKTEVEK